ncbi:MULTISPECIES: hypothetical protein [unclassified Lactobacillus]|uniref:P8 family protein n=1 Tax=unclassified Lactobacillus TaxID=2620435 RepID=UPI000EFAA988|nr:MULTISPECIES: hypothetical protein [unclassified Lactobacillus]RMC38419.1 hypothetical protein F5ESL0237_05620 [Lactobacillus sp. ESL0237]RMC43227.1 hypothetical protein F5ESL0234_05625 [Lactobacillus sp. ESL0234]RMC44254.1 hypothetical protein F5ESL0236_05630 [Lactobacillus sp. ESL0236]RMC45235.1 hypothetical protein F5ESL0230_06440 [Lactobacillus sp. ESL0230]RMC49222.1 hypothetical protein F5ESL0225_06010 [Lactobacillus sp. ESL0225]
MTEELSKSTLLNQPMKEVFDWSDLELSVRDVLWDYLLEKDGRDAIKAEEDMLYFLNVGDEKIKLFLTENLKK